MLELIETLSWNEAREADDARDEAAEGAREEAAEGARDEAAEALDEVETRERREPRREPMLELPGETGGVA